jgi:hypothetical protein
MLIHWTALADKGSYRSPTKLEPGIHKVTADRKLDRVEAISYILKDWLIREGLVADE